MKPYQKVTKFTTKIAPIILFHINGINKKIENCVNSNNIVVALTSYEHEYCYDAIQLVIKTYRRKGYNCFMSSYQRYPSNTKNMTSHAYVWALSKKK